MWDQSRPKQVAHIISKKKMINPTETININLTTVTGFKAIQCSLLGYNLLHILSKHMYH